ncbi:hypothetical protein MRB53_025203 [Persea americana]|nr:hypothetical protein MRB53_025203 [Persea americana]
MQRLGIIPTPYVFFSVLSACAKTELFENGKQLPAQVFKWGFHFVGDAPVTLYSRHGNLGLAEKVFAEMHRLKPDAVTFASLFSACVSAGDLDNGRHLNSHVTKAEHSSNIIIEGSLLDLYVKCADIETAHESFNTINRENVVLWNAMLVAYGHMGNLIEFFELFSQMQVAGMRPNQYTYPSILRTCTSLGALDLGEQIHSQIVKTGFEQNIYVCSVLIDMYAKCGRLGIAREFLERLTEEDVVSWTIMIAGYAQHEFFVEALRLFEEMQSIGIRPDNIGFSSALSACAEIQVLKQGLQIHAQAVVTGFSMDLSIGNSLVSLYSRCGIIKEAYSAFEMIEAKDEISWNRLILGFAQSGHCEVALEVFAEMNRECVRANLFTFGFAISASANIAEIKQGKQNHGRMIKTSYDSEIKASNVLITLYSKCGNIDGANREFYEMLERNEVSWNAMITGYSQHGFGIEALKLFEQMKQQGFKPNHVTFVSISLQPLARTWDLRDKVRQMMKEKGVKKEPGRSWIEIKNSVHAFFVGDRMHPMADKIYKCLEDLNKRAAKIGYVQDRYSLLHDIEPEQKDPTVFIHSEKLAIKGFGIEIEVKEKV